MTDKTSFVTNPATCDVIAYVADLSVAETSAAVDAVYVAMADWAAWTVKDRAVVLRKWYDLMLANADDFATILTTEMGKPWAEARGEIMHAASFIEWFS